MRVWTVPVSKFPWVGRGFSMKEEGRRCAEQRIADHLTGRDPLTEEELARALRWVSKRDLLAVAEAGYRSLCRVTGEIKRRAG